MAPAASLEPDKVIDLMAALEASVAAAKEARGRHPTSLPADGTDEEAADDEAAAEPRPARSTKKAAKSAGPLDPEP